LAGRVTDFHLGAYNERGTIIFIFSENLVLDDSTKLYIDYEILTMKMLCPDSLGALLFSLLPPSYMVVSRRELANILPSSD